MRQRKATTILRFGLVLLMAASVGRAAPQSQTQPPAYTQAEYEAYLAAKTPQALDAFASKYPNSALLPYAYRAFYLTYWHLNDSPKTILYIDKLLALGDKIDPETRLITLVARAQAYVAGCRDESLQTLEAYTKARDAAAEGIQIAGTMQKPSDLTDVQFAHQKPSSTTIFSAAAGIAESGLGNPKVDTCKSPLMAAGDKGRFDSMISEILVEQRQSPRVR